MKPGCRAPLPIINRSTSGYWKSGSLIECTGLTDEKNDVRSYHFKDPAGGGFKFKAGQHISILLPLENAEDYRTFTICSSPTQPDEITLTVKTNHPDGATAWMRKNINVGSTFKAVGPTGLFNIADYPCNKLLLISAGSGITPMMSMLRWLFDRNDELDITFIHYAMNCEQYLFSEALSETSSQYSSLNYYQISTHREDGPIHGLPTAEQIASITEFTDQQVFCCGPAGFMKAIKNIVLAGGLNPDHYHEESFGSEQTEPEIEQTADDAESVMVNYKDKRFEAGNGVILLTALKQNKFVVPTGCRSGMCGTCQMKLESGTVQMNQQGGLSQQQVEDGYILACCSTLTGNLTIS